MTPQRAPVRMDAIPSPPGIQAVPAFSMKRTKARQ